MQARRVVMLVANDVEGDSRVLKSAASAQQAGYEVTVVGRAHHQPAGEFQIEGVRVIRLRPVYALHDAMRQRGQEHRLHRARVRAASFDLRATSWRRRTIGAERRRLADRAGARWRQGLAFAWWHTVGGGPLVRAVRGAGDRLRPVRARVSRTSWRRDWPLFVDYQVAFVPAVLDLRPDLIHAHDVHLAHVADLAARILRRDGVRTRWVYDAHEWLPGVPFETTRWQQGTLGLERDQITRADAVLTVSDVLADQLVRRYRLADRPTVVENAPMATRAEAPDRQTLRAELGLGAQDPLLVYSGALAERRGVLEAVRALPLLEGVHLAVVANPAARYADVLRAEAQALGVGDRLHLRPYVPSAAITWYLASADLGLAPFHRTPSHDTALATKVREYLHAGLPIVGSDCLVMAQFLRETGVGEVFTAADHADLARAVGAALAGLGGLRAAITPQLLAEHSWEDQAARLVAVYGRLSDR